MTKKKRELIEILLDNVKPEDWPEGAVYAAQDKETLTWGKQVLMFYSDFEIPHVNVGRGSFSGKKVGHEIKLPELCKHWNKTIVHRDEFMKRWNERNHVVYSDDWNHQDDGISVSFVDASPQLEAQSDGIEKVIADRGMNYGRFEDGAEIMQQLKLIAHTSQGWERMKPIQREGMDMILHKIGRILNGDPAYVDSWIDIEGYSKLVSSWLKGESK